MNPNNIPHFVELPIVHASISRQPGDRKQGGLVRTTNQMVYRMRLPLGTPREQGRDDMNSFKDKAVTRQRNIFLRLKIFHGNPMVLSLEILPITIFFTK